ncbi:MAG: DNA-packaging protein [Proteobacteria bacterium]|nr:DNA-packaging protein [Pseudomonadota bacterium]
MGRPPKYTNPEDFAAKANAYFAECKIADPPEVPTVNGLCLALDMTRDTLLEYGDKPDFSDTVKKVRMRLEAAWEQRLAGNNVAGSIFWLKNQGWSDRHEVVQTGVTVILDGTDAKA